MKEKRVIYYSDEINDDFAATKNHSKKIIDKNYNYNRENKLLWRIWAGFLHYVIVKPVTHLIMVFGYHYKVLNRKKFKEIKKQSCFVYSNHTNYMPDAYIPNHLAYKKVYIIVDSTAVSIKGVAGLVVALGGIPLADTMEAKKNYLRLLKKLSTNNSIITIYPEAHIWPYYTKIRPFPKESLKYPIMYDVPAFAVTNCYQKRKHSDKVKMRTYVDGPFYPDKTLGKQEMLDKLYDQVITAMRERTEKYSTYEYVKYIKKENTEEETNLI